jgi:hypothetical protein
MPDKMQFIDDVAKRLFAAHYAEVKVQGDTVLMSPDPIGDAARRAYSYANGLWDVREQHIKSEVERTTAPFTGWEDFPSGGYSLELGKWFELRVNQYDDPGEDFHGRWWFALRFLPSDTDLRDWGEKDYATADEAKLAAFDRAKRVFRDFALIGWKLRQGQNGPAGS